MFGTLLLQYILGLESTNIWQYQQPPEPTPFIQKVVTQNLVTIKPVTTNGTIAPGTQRVPVLEATFTTSCNDEVQLWNLELQRRGLGASSDITALYATQNGNRISTTRSVPTSGEVTLSLREVELQDCKATVIILADFSPTASPFGQHQFIVSSVQASVPLTVEIANTITTNVGNTTPGLIQVTNLAPISRVRIGNKATVGRVRLEAVEKNQQLISILFSNRGSAQNNDLTNFYMTDRAGNFLSTITSQMDDKRVNIQFVSDVVLAEDTSIELLLKADYLSSRSNTVDFTVEQPTDVVSITTTSR